MRNKQKRIIPLRCMKGLRIKDEEYIICEEGRKKVNKIVGFLLTIFGNSDE